MYKHIFCSSVSNVESWFRWKFNGNYMYGIHKLRKFSLFMMKLGTVFKGMLQCTICKLYLVLHFIDGFGSSRDFLLCLFHIGRVFPLKMQAQLVQRCLTHLFAVHFDMGYHFHFLRSQNNSRCLHDSKSLTSNTSIQCCSNEENK